MDYDASDYLCAPSPTGVCNHRFDTPGLYYYTSGKVTNNAEPVAFSGKVIVLNLNERTETLAVFKKGKIPESSSLPSVSKKISFLTFVKLYFLTCLSHLSWCLIHNISLKRARCWNLPIAKEDLHLLRVLHCPNYARSATLLKKALAQVFSCEFCEIFKKIVFHRTPPGDYFCNY